MAVNVVILGPPGAGKGTQAERFARDHGIPKISTGDILREAAKSGSPIGRVVQAVMARGELVSDDLMIDIVRERLSRPDAAAGFVLDGFPRTTAQAQALDEMLAGREPVVCIEIQVPDEVLIDRLRNRRVCADCGANAEAFGGTALPASCRQPARCAAEGPRWISRADDSEAVVRERLQVYRRDTRPVIEFYRGRPTYRAIDGHRSPEEVRAAIADAVASARGRPVGQES